MCSIDPCVNTNLPSHPPHTQVNGQQEKHITKKGSSHESFSPPRSFVVQRVKKKKTEHHLSLMSFIRVCLWMRKMNRINICPCISRPFCAVSLAQLSIFVWTSKFAVSINIHKHRSNVKRIMPFCNRLLSSNLCERLSTWLRSKLH